MALSKITVNVGSSGIGRRTLNRDKISGFIFFIANANLPSGFLTTAREKKVFSLAEAEALGIVKGSANHAVHWYHISEYFRMNPEGELWIGYYPLQVAFLYAEIATFMLATNGEVRLLSIYNADSPRAFLGSEVTVIQAAIDALDPAYRQVSVFWAPDFSAITAITGWASVADLRALTAKKVTVVIAESASGEGLVQQTAKAYSITAVGAAMGAASKASVEQSIGNPANFPISNGSELETLALANGDLLSAISIGTLGALKDKGYLIARKYLPDLSGSYFERCPVSAPLASAFNWLETNRVVDKAIRNVRTALTPYLNGTVALKADGTLSDDSVGFYLDIAQAPLDEMIVLGNVSAAKAYIDPVQNVLGTSKLVVSIKIVLIGIAEEIVVNINLTASLS